MFERFTSEARSAVVAAQREARGLGHDRIGTGHVLLGLLREPSSAGGRALVRLGVDPGHVRDEVVAAFSKATPGFGPEDADALQALGIDLEEVRRAAEESFGPGALDRARLAGRGHIPFTPGSKRTLELALREAIRLGHSYIGTEHVLLGLVRDRRSLAARILLRRGVDADRVRDAVHREIENGGDRPGRTA